MAFVKVIKTSRIRIPFDCVKVRKSELVFGSKVKEHIKAGDKIELLIDEQARKIGFKKTEDSDAFRVRTDNRYAIFISCATTLKDIQRKHYKVVQEDGMWVFKFDWILANGGTR